MLGHWTACCLWEWPSKNAFAHLTVNSACCFAFNKTEEKYCPCISDPAFMVSLTPVSQGKPCTLKGHIHRGTWRRHEVLLTFFTLSHTNNLPTNILMAAFLLAPLLQCTSREKASDRSFQLKGPQELRKTISCAVALSHSLISSFLFYKSLYFHSGLYSVFLWM